MPSKIAPVLKSVTPDTESTGKIEPDATDSIEPEPQPDKKLAPISVPAPESAASAPFRRTRRLAKLVVALALLAGCGVGVYIGWPTVRERYIQPVETTATDVTVLQAQLAETLTRIETLENELAAAQVATVAQAETVTELQATTESLMNQDLESERTLVSHTTRLSALTDQIQALKTNDDQADQVAMNQAITMVAAQYLGRSRLFLYQANYGLAEQDIAAALESLQEVPTDAQNTGVIERLTLAAEALPERPVLAADELDIAWHALLSESGPG